MIAILCIALSIVYLVLNISLVAIRNYKAHQFYKQKSPNLPVVPNPNIFAGHMYKITLPGKNCQIIDKLHDEYGPTFGFFMSNQPWVSTKDIDLVKLIKVDQGYKHVNRTKFGLPFNEINKSIFQIDDDDWRRVRRSISPALTNHKVRTDEVSSDIESILDQLAESFRRKVAKAERETGSRSFIIDVHNTFKRYTLAVIFLITYKKENVIDFNSPKEEWIEDMEDGEKNITNPIVCLGIMFPFLRPLCAFIVQFHRVGQLQDKIVDYIIKATDINRFAREAHKKIQRKMSLETGQKERPFEELKRSGKFKRRLIDSIIDAFLDKKIKYDEFIGTALFMLLAGFETTADTITCLVWQLAWHPEIQEKMRKSMLEEGIDSEYVMWCIMETIRFHPAVPLGAGRILADDVCVNGTFLAKGTFVMPSIYSIHHDPKIWPEPEEFKPERWKDSADFHPAAFVGFGLGPRNCVGGKLAVHEIKLVMRLILTNYRIERCQETSDKYDFTSPGLVYTILDQPIKVRFVEINQQ